MPPFRNPFGKKPPANGLLHDENTPPSKLDAANGERPGYASSRASSTLSIRKKEEPAEYKLSGRCCSSGRIVVYQYIYFPP